MTLGRPLSFKSRETMLQFVNYWRAYPQKPCWGHTTLWCPMPARHNNTPLSHVDFFFKKNLVKLIVYYMDNCSQHLNDFLLKSYAAFSNLCRRIKLLKHVTMSRCGWSWRHCCTKSICAAHQTSLCNSALLLKCRVPVLHGGQSATRSSGSPCV